MGRHDDASQSTDNSGGAHANKEDIDVDSREQENLARIRVRRDGRSHASQPLDGKSLCSTVAQCVDKVVVASTSKLPIRQVVCTSTRMTFTLVLDAVGGTKDTMPTTLLLADMPECVRPCVAANDQTW